MGLRETLSQSDFDGKDDQQSLALLTETVTISIDSLAYTWSGLGKRLLAIGVDPAIVMNARPLVQNITRGGVTLDGCLTSGGFDCSSDENRQLIAAAGVNAPPDAVTLMNAMLQVGRTTGPRWSLPANGIESQPTLEQIAAARAANATYNWWAQVRDEVVPPMLTAGASIETIKAAIAGAE